MDNNLVIKQVLIGPMMNYGYIVGNRKTGTAAVIDPGWDTAHLIETAKKEGLKITDILTTHTHFDHINDVPKMVKETGSTIYVHTNESNAPAAAGTVREVNDGDIISAGGVEFKVMHTPGHTRGSVCYITGDALFTGDTLFVDAIGRTDLEDGDPETMFLSLQKIKSLPDKMIIYPGHHYGSEPTSTIGEQKKRNPYLANNSLPDFLRMV